MLLTLFKLYGIVYPFIKEIFFGKDIRDQRRGRRAPAKNQNTFTKKFLMIGGLLSFFLCIYLGSRLWDLSKEYSALKKGQLGAEKTQERPRVPEVAVSVPEVTPVASAPEPVVKASERRHTPAVDVPLTVKPARTEDEISHEVLIRTLKELQ